MTSPPEPSPSGDTTAALAVQVAALRGQVRLIFARLEQAGLTGDLNLADRLAELARTVTQSLDRPPRGPAAPYWIGLDPAEHAAQLAGLRQWADTVLRREYGGYQLPACWANHPHAIWELSTLAAEWHRTYARSTAQPGPGTGIPRPVAARHHAPHRRHHPPVQPRMRRPAASAEARLRTHALRPPAATGSGKGPAIMTLVKLTPAELRLLDIQKARGIPYPDDIFAWREANAAAIAALELRAEAEL